MLTRNFEPTRPYRYLMYGRMSDPRQNPRSPDQQFDTCTATMKRMHYPWVQVKTYRDDGISGRYLKKRPEYQAMLRDVELDLVAVDLIVVDTIERLGRTDEIAELRRKLFTEHGILVVTADSNFADPTGATGKALTFIEDVRSTEDGRVKAHNVIRGKKDAAEQGRWPGGSAPLGFRLKPVLDESARPPRTYSVLEPVPAHIAAVRLLFRRAAETGHGRVRLTTWWNSCPEIPDDLKPTRPDVIAYALENEIYIGTLVWGANCTGVVNDTRVTEPNPDGPRVLVPGFCEPQVDAELFERVGRLRVARSERALAARAKNHTADTAEKLIAPQVRGLALKYLLTGLVRCGCCRASMRPVPARRTEGDKTYEYVYYSCPMAVANLCPNKPYVREDKLREAVVARVRARLFPPPDETGQVPDWVPELVDRVRDEVAKLRAAGPERDGVRRDEVRQLEERLTGWAISLGDPSLPPGVRADLTVRYEQAKHRRAELEARAEEDRALDRHLDRTLDPRAVLGHLGRLADALTGHNPTLGNLELGRHVEHVLCFPDGRVEMRGTWLGVFDGAEHLLGRGAATNPVPATPAAGTRVVRPRTRTRLRVPNLSADANAAPPLAGDARLDPERFAGLDDAFFWDEPLAVERDRPWSEEHAAEVARARAEGLTHERLAERFGVTVPTIRKALAFAAAKDPSVARLPRKQPRGRWPDAHYVEVAALAAEGKSVKQIAAHFGVSPPLVRNALKIAAAAGGETGPSPGPLPAPTE